MSKVIIYPQGNGICVINPNLNCGLSIDEIAMKDTPEGIPFRIIDASELPDDIEFVSAWRSDFSKTDGVGVGHKKWFASRGINV